MANADDIIKAMRQLHGFDSRKIESDGVTTAVVVVPEGMTIHPVTDFVDKLLPIPRRKCGTFQFFDLADLCAYSKEHAAAYLGADGNATTDSEDVDEGSPHAFVDTNSGKVVVVFNHHSPDFGGQAHGDHRAFYDPKFSPQWNIWTKKYEPFSPGDFADFIDDNIEDIGPEPEKDDKTDPGKRLKELAKLYGTSFATREELIALSKGIRIHAKDQVEHVVDPQTGEVSFNYTNEQTARGAKGEVVKVPGLFILQIPVFEKGDYFRLPVRLRHRVNGASVTWTFKIVNLDRAKETAISDIKAAVAVKTGLFTFFGTP